MTNGESRKLLKPNPFAFFSPLPGCCTIDPTTFERHFCANPWNCNLSFSCKKIAVCLIYAGHNEHMFKLLLLAVDLYMSPVETWCYNLNYYIPDVDGRTKDFSVENMTRIREF